jgi:multiple sugar transport system permease protein
MSEIALPASAPAAKAKASGPRSQRVLPYLLSLPALLVCIAILIPFFTSAYDSLLRYNLGLPYLKGFIGLDNYLQFLNDPAFWNTVKVSAIYTVSTVVLELLLGLGIAMLLRARTRFNNFCSVVLLLPLMCAPVLAALMWKLMTDSNFGVLNWAVSQLGITNMRWASDAHTAMFTVVLIDIWVYTPFMMVLLLAGLRSLPQQPFEAARLDGVPGHFVFFRITLPMLTPYIITAALFRLLDSIQQFDIVYAMTQGGPGDSLMLFQVRAYLEFFTYQNVGHAAALMMILWAITYALSNVFVKQMRRLREKTHATV